GRAAVVSRAGVHELAPTVGSPAAISALPLAGVPAPNEPRLAREYFDDQPISRAGIAVDEKMRAVNGDSEPVYENLHVAGATLAGAVPWREASGNGISLSSGYAAAEAILEVAS